MIENSSLQEFIQHHNSLDGIKLSDEKQNNFPNCIFIIEISQHNELTTHRICLEIQNSMLGEKNNKHSSKPDDNVFKEKASYGNE